MDKTKHSNKVYSKKNPNSNISEKASIDPTRIGWGPIIVALITLVGVIYTATINSEIILKFISPPTPAPIFTFTPTLTPTPTLTSTFTLTPTPTISILNIQNTTLEPINEKFAPYDVFVSGKVSNAKGSYLYLIVDDGAKKWIQNPLGIITEDDFLFSGHCFLGNGPTNPFAQDKPYIIYAVISNNDSYMEHGDFTAEIPIAESRKITLVRKDLPTPTP